MNAVRVIVSLPLRCGRLAPRKDSPDGIDEFEPFGGLFVETPLPRIGDGIILARRARRRFFEIVGNQSLALHAPHQRIDRAFTHIHRCRQPAGNLVGIRVASRKQRKDAKAQHPLLELDFNTF